MLVSNGLTNGVINGIIYYFITSGSVAQKDYMFWMIVSNAILGAILINLYPVLIKGKLRKHPDIKIPYTKENHIVASLYPANAALVRIINVMICMILSTVLTMGLIGCCCLSELSVLAGAIFRGIDCAVFSVFAYYFSVLVYKPVEEK